jgi:hypothetical protein
MRRRFRAPHFIAMTAGQKITSWSRVPFRFRTALLSIVAVVCSTNISLADEGGISFWIPGFFGSLAATPQQPGWSLASIYYHTDVSASGNAAVAREITIGQFNPKINISVNANIHGVADLGFVIPSCVFATPFLGGQASASLLMGYGNNDAALNATATATTAAQLNHRLRCVSLGHCAPEVAAHFASCAARLAASSFFTSSGVSFGGSTETVTLLILPVNANGI